MGEEQPGIRNTFLGYQYNNYYFEAFKIEWHNHNAIQIVIKALCRADLSKSKIVYTYKQKFKALIHLIIEQIQDIANKIKKFILI